MGVNYRNDSPTAIKELSAPNHKMPEDKIKTASFPNVSALHNITYFILRYLKIPEFKIIKKPSLLELLHTQKSSLVDSFLFQDCTFLLNELDSLEGKKLF